MSFKHSFRSACARIISAEGSVLGTGFLVTERHILTAAHVVGERPDETYRVLFPSATLRARVLKVDRDTDCAVLETDAVAEDITPIPLGLDVASGDKGVLFGYSRILDSAISFEVEVQDVLRDGAGRFAPSIIVLPASPLGREVFAGFSGAPLLVADKAAGMLTVSVHIDSGVTAILSCTRIQDAIRLLPAGVAERLTPPASPRTAAVADGPLPVLCVAALDEELDCLFDMPLGWGGVHLQSDGLSFRRARLVGNTDIIATSARGMGLVATAVMVAKALKEWKPIVAIMIGICGGRKEKGINLGDIIAPDQCFHYQFGAFRDGRIERDLKVENTEGQILDLVSHMKRTPVLSKIRRSVPRAYRRPASPLQCHIGPMASADLVVKDTSKFGEAIEADRRTLGVDMESYAFLRAAKLASVRWAFVAKAVTDFADAKKDDDYRDYAKYVSTAFAIELARGLVAGLSQVRPS